jgi:phospholipase/lecithinase/hemolysin
MKSLLFSLSFTFALCILQNPSQAASFSQLLVYGDSLSDVGRVGVATGGAFPPYGFLAGGGRFSNGPVWVEYLAAKIGLTSDFSNNFAIGGATSGSLNTITAEFPTVTGGLLSQVADNPIADPAALYIVWAGANDYLGGGVTNPAIPVGNISTAIAQLAGIGAQNFLVANLSDLGSLPVVQGDPVTAAGLSALTIGHNQLLNLALANLGTTFPSVDITLLDINQFFNTVTAEPFAYGLTNTTDACITETFLCADPSGYLYWDILHPTTTSHQQIAHFAAQTLGVPEPLTLLGASTAIAFGVKFKRRSRTEKL